MRVAARPENRFKPRRLILTFSYRFAKFPNSFFSLHRASQPPAKAFPSPRGGNTVPKFPYLPYFVRSANPALCKLRFIPQTASVFLPPSCRSSAIDTSAKFRNRVDKSAIHESSTKCHRGNHGYFKVVCN